MLVPALNPPFKVYSMHMVHDDCFNYYKCMDKQLLTTGEEVGTPSREGYQLLLVVAVRDTAGDRGRGGEEAGGEDLATNLPL